MEVKPIYDPACLKGTLRSLLQEAFPGDARGQAIINALPEPDSNGYIEFNPHLLKRDLCAMFGKVDTFEIRTKSDFLQITENPVDNENSYGILFWHGRPNPNQEGATDNAHVTRVIKINETTLNLLSTTPIAEIRDYNQNELFDASTNGFSFWKIEKTIVEEKF